MHLNATRLATGTTLEADVAIVGAGPAGITLALELADAGYRTILVESGGSSFDDATQRLGDTTEDDSAHVPMSLATRRQIGGASNLWAGRCVPFDPIDFQHRAIVEHARWPVSYADVELYFARACAWCMCGEAVFDARRIPSLASVDLIPGWRGGEIRSTSLERWSLPTNFGRAYGSKLRESRLVTLVSMLTCTEVVCDATGHAVDHLRARTLDGKAIRISAKRYVLACGGVETTRLLLASRAHHAGGIGNHSGHLGRWYMSHVGASVAEVNFDTPAQQTIYGFERDEDGIYVRRRITFSQDFLTTHDLPNAAIWLENPDIGDPSHQNAILSFVYLILASPLGRYVIAEGIRQRKIGNADSASSPRHVWNIVRNLPRAVWFALTFGYERYLRRGHKIPGVFIPNRANAYRLYYHGEHLPHSDSRIVLTGERDELGMPRVRTELRFHDDDIEGGVCLLGHLDDYLRRHRLGRLEYLSEDPVALMREQLLDGYHQAGTTRMSARPEDGVLDRRLAVHGFDDLFVASSSAFVTSGQANSTFMIVVFALRLADHLRSSLQRPSIELAATPETVKVRSSVAS